MSLKIKVKKLGNTPVLSVYGDITGSNIGKLTARLEYAQNSNSPTIGIDVSNVSFIDSHGLGVFVFFYRRLHEQNRRLVIIRPTPFFRDLFSGSNLDRIFTIIDSEDEL